MIFSGLRVAVLTVTGGITVSPFRLGLHASSVQPPQLYVDAPQICRSTRSACAFAAFGCLKHASARTTVTTAVAAAAVAAAAVAPEASARTALTTALSPALATATLATTVATATLAARSATFASATEPSPLTTR